ncbi:MAG: outer membrane protein assembly factor BamA [Halothiobacillus sp. 20-53-49]|nr:outer membrane protein assembly factor BamA [Halothiobacillaceae bacterium]OYV47603.1 MAG: outer membrane protein assembly factor BamA [Halothiobacillus sp. 20-53-49]HQS02677.1 outer membrane protein assembly factor BamA [Halothiobacillus sp.]HQS28862.1 outer membrane protein assembly factor BamA [Halothiobacillus sp.]HUM99251.1 outer membrane protein assembly factor BamA [Halothiobacillus sp.]
MTSLSRFNMARRLMAPLAGLLFLVPALAHAFVISDIKVEGLRTVTPSTLFTYVPYKVGENFTAQDSTQVIDSLYKTGFFSNVTVGQVGNVLMIQVQERPTISAIEVKGNKKVETEKLQKALKDIGLSQGHLLDPQALDKMKTELQRVYYSLGQYGVQIETSVKPLDDNRVFVLIDIYEGKPASIRQVRIVGNHDFSESQLLGELSMHPTSWWEFWSSADQYSKEKMSADLESLRAFYLNRGYLKFAVDSSQVTITPDRKQIDVVINISEGPRYKVSDVRFSGNLLLDKATLEQLDQVKKDAYFNRKEIIDTSDAISKRLGNDGYALARVQPMPKIDEENKTVAVDFNIQPGDRVTVRHVEFTGNFNTNEDVYRREMRQMEGSWYAADKLDRSKERLQRLPSVQKVDQSVKPVPGVADQVDVDYDITEQLSGSFTAGVGYSQSEGVLFNLGLNQSNFLGSGKSVGINMQRSSYQTGVQFNYNNPYFTVDGVSQGFGLFYSRQDAAALSLSKYLVDSYGGNINFGVPLSENTYGSIAFQAQEQKIKSTTYSPSWITGVPVVPTGAYPVTGLGANGYDIAGPGFDNKSFFTFSVIPTLRYDTRNKSVFPTSGILQSVSATMAVPGSQLLYYKGDYKGRIYMPLWSDTTLSAHGQVGMIKAYGNTQSTYGSPASQYYNGVPPFLNYYSGGIQSVRGFQDYSLGPRDSNGDPMGGTFLTAGGLELITPLPFLTSQANSVRLSLFWDVGNVYSSYSNFSAQELRQSVGVGFNWISPVGPLVFSVAKPLNSKPGDLTQVFQFTVGTSF